MLVVRRLQVLGHPYYEEKRASLRLIAEGGGDEEYELHGIDRRSAADRSLGIAQLQVQYYGHKRKAA